MPEKSDEACLPQLWARFRFSIVGLLLAAPPEPGKLGEQIDCLAAKLWRHPISGKLLRYSRSTIERWYYRAAAAPLDPVGALSRQVRSDRGTVRVVNNALLQALRNQYKSYPSWSYRLHADNLAVVVREQPQLGPMPSYRTLLRTMKSLDMIKRRRLGPPKSPGAQQAQARLETREVRSWDSQYTNALWHLDYHHGSLRVLLAGGQWAYPVLLGILDDHSRLCCHAQWYLAETAENLVHGLSQAILKRGLPRALMSDNGSPMIAAETTQGLQRLGIVHEKTLPYSPYQNGKQECFWAQVEGRLLAMLSSTADLSLASLNEATLAWVEMEYNRKLHSELGRTPLESFLHDKDVARQAPSSQELCLAFTQSLVRTQRRSDGTASVHGRRFEVPSCYNHLRRLHVRLASWDLSQVHLCDPATDLPIARLYPLDKHNNANAHRRTKMPLTPLESATEQQPSDADGPAPLLRKLIADYAATGLPPAYIPKDQTSAASQEAAKRKENSL